AGWLHHGRGDAAHRHADPAPEADGGDAGGVPEVEGGMTRAGAVLVVAALLGGCVDAPPTTPSEVALKPETLGLGGTATPAISDPWWMAFHDPQLNALVDEALKGSPTLAAALARVRLAQSELSATRAATYPQVTFDANETRERFSKDYIIPPPIGG